MEFLTGKRVSLVFSTEEQSWQSGDHLVRGFTIGNLILGLIAFAYFCSIPLQTPAKTYNQISGVFASVCTGSLLAGNT